MSQAYYPPMPRAEQFPSEPAFIEAMGKWQIEAAEIHRREELASSLTPTDFDLIVAIVGIAHTNDAEQMWVTTREVYDLLQKRAGGDEDLWAAIRRTDRLIKLGVLEVRRQPSAADPLKDWLYIHIPGAPRIGEARA
jgi:hypothetical protein